VQRDGHHALMKLGQAQDVGLTALAAPRIEALPAKLCARAAIKASDNLFEAALDVGERDQLVLHAGPKVVRVGGRRAVRSGRLDDG
jgi:hypothetical protein